MIRDLWTNQVFNGHILIQAETNSNVVIITTIIKGLATLFSHRMRREERDDFFTTEKRTTIYKSI